MPKSRCKRAPKVFCFALTLALACLASAVSFAHPLAPSLLEITEKNGGEAEVFWKTPLAKIPGEELKPQLPAECHSTQEAEVQRIGTAHLERWRVACAKSWVGSAVGVSGLSSNQPNAILRVALANGLVYQQVLNADAPRFLIPERPRVSEVFKNYFELGVEHILTGWDHLLFVLGLVLLVRGRKLLLWTVTAFTVGHSFTLSAAALDWVRIPSAPVEALIAFSIFILAVELLRPQKARGTFFHRYPWALAFGFGLLHGLGFAGALAEVGLPVGEIPMALFSFNVGIEAGQLFFIAVILMLGALCKALPLPAVARRMAIPAYAIGSLAAFWCLERLSNR